jgi:hypothetical protein
MSKKTVILASIVSAIVLGVVLFNHVFILDNGKIWTPSDLFASTPQRITVRDAQFFEGGEDTVNSVLEALVMDQLLGGSGGLCDRGVTCEGRVVMKAGTKVNVLRAVQLKSNMLDETFDLVETGHQKGWITERAF